MTAVSDPRRLARLEERTVGKCTSKLDAGLGAWLDEVHAFRHAVSPQSVRKLVRRELAHTIDVPAASAAAQPVSAATQWFSRLPPG